MRQVIGVLLLAASPLAAQERTIAGAPKRVMLPVQWDSIGAVSESALEEVAKPYVVKFIDTAAVLVDYRDKVVLRAFSTRGVPLWTYARRGKGPQEVEYPGGLSIGADGLGWLTDRGNARVYGFAVDGKVVGTQPLEFMPERAATISRSEMVVMSGAFSPSGPKRFALGERAVQAELPLAELVRASDVAARAVADVLGLPGRRFVVAYFWGSVIALYEGDKLVAEMLGPDAQNFPQRKLTPVGKNAQRLGVEGWARQVALSLSSAGQRLYVHGGVVPKAAGGEPGRKYIDVYDLVERRYVGSIVTPRPTDQLTVRDGVVALLNYEEDVGLSFWRMRETGASRR